jgi:ABC-type dipeptide/oligopeptide/nickel transport system permease subunit
MLTPAILLAVALSAILGFISLRRAEEARGARYFEAERTILDERAAILWTALVLGGVPVSWRNYARAVLHDVTHLSVHSAVEAVRAVERPLAKLSYKMRVSAPKSGNAPVSNFLRTITPEKK